MAPAAGDTVNISNGDTVETNGLSGGNLPNGVTINLTGNSGLGGSSVVRLAGATINLSTGSGLSGGFWDLNNGTLVFQNGSAATMSNWESKGTNSFQFVLGASGFTTLTPGTYRNDGNNTALSLAQKMALATYQVDLASYTGGVGSITLIDYGSDGTVAGLDDATFQNANFVYSNVPTGLSASLQWNDAQDSVVLNLTAIPEPSTLGVLIAGLGVLMAVRRRRRSIPTAS